MSQEEKIIKVEVADLKELIEVVKDLSEEVKYLRESLQDNLETIISTLRFGI